MEIMWAVLLLSFLTCVQEHTDNIKATNVSLRLNSWLNLNKELIIVMIGPKELRKNYVIDYSS